MNQYTAITTRLPTLAPLPTPSTVGTPEPSDSSNTTPNTTENVTKSETPSPLTAPTPGPSTSATPPATTKTTPLGAASTSSSVVTREDAKIEDIGSEENADEVISKAGQYAAGAGGSADLASELRRRRLEKFSKTTDPKTQD